MHRCAAFASHAAALARTRLELAAVVLSAVVGSAVHLAVPFARPVADASTYDAIAAGIVGIHKYGPYYGQHWAVGGLFVRGFLYPVLISFVYWVTGGAHPEVVGWVQAVVLLPTTTWLVFVAGRTMFSRRVGVIAACGFALWLPAAWHTDWLLMETLLDLMLALVLVLIARTLTRTSIAVAAALGLTLGVLAISHAAYQWLWVIVVITLTLASAFGRRSLAPATAVVTLATLAVLVPYHVVAKVEHRATTGTGGRGYGGGGGWTFYVGSRPQTDFRRIPDDFKIGDLSAPGQLVRLAHDVDEGKVYMEPHLRKILEEKAHRANALHETLTDSDYYRAGLQNLLSDPLGWPRKVWFNGSTLFALPADLDLYKPDVAPGTTWFRDVWRPLSIALFALAAVGLIVVALRRRIALILFVPLVFETAIVIASYAEARYVIPLLSSMFLLAAVAVDAAWRAAAPG